MATGDLQIFDRALLRQRRRQRPSSAHGDFLHREVAERIAERVAVVNRPFASVLDLGGHCAPLLRQVLPDAQIVAVSPFGGAAVTAEEEALPLALERFDLIVSAWQLHMVNDLPGALIQMRACLKPDGLLLAAMAGGNTLRELRESFAAAEMATLNGVSPRVAPFADVRDGGALLQRAGFALPVADMETLTVDYGDLIGLLRDLRAMGQTNVLLQRLKRPLRRDTLAALLAHYGEHFARPDGRVPATFEILFMTGWAPHDSQQKPLRPGSAAARLADALGTAEISTGDKAGPDGDR